WDFLMRWPMPQSRHDVHPRGAFTRDGLCPKAAKKTRGANSQPRVVKVVPKGGLEPPRSYPLPPQGSASTNSATWAKVVDPSLGNTAHIHVRDFSRKHQSMRTGWRTARRRRTG